jgi:hypothetical protein
MKRVRVVHRGLRPNNFKPPSEAAWRDIEEQSGFRLDSITRCQINRITLEYVTKGPGSAAVLSPLQLKKQVGRWIVRTDGLRTQIASLPGEEQRKVKNYLPGTGKTVSASVAYANLTKMADMYFRSIGEIAVPFSTDHLAKFLSEVTKLTEGMAIHIGRRAPAPPSKIQWWLVWVTLVILQVRKNGFSVSWRKGKKKGVRDEFVQFVSLLQKHMPIDCAPRRSHESVRKGIVLAIPLTEGQRAADLKSILRRWGQGEFVFAAKAASSGMRDPKMFMIRRMLQKIDKQAGAIGNANGSQKVANRS